MCVNKNKKLEKLLLIAPHVATKYFIESIKDGKFDQWLTSADKIVIMSGLQTLHSRIDRKGEFNCSGVKTLHR